MGWNQCLQLLWGGPGETELLLPIMIICKVEQIIHMYALAAFTTAPSIDSVMTRYHARAL